MQMPTQPPANQITQLIAPSQSGYQSHCLAFSRGKYRKRTALIILSYHLQKRISFEYLRLPRTKSSSSCLVFMRQQIPLEADSTKSVVTDLFSLCESLVVVFIYIYNNPPMKIT